MAYTATARRRSSALPRFIAGSGLVAAVAVLSTIGFHAVSSWAPPVGELGRDGGGGAATQTDGVVPDGATVFDQYPGVVRLDPDLLAALRRAAADAAGDGVTIGVNSGWRSRAYQDQLLREAVAEYGSEAEAARWVATADTSPHVSGDAVDLGPSAAVAWLAEHGSAYGLCQVYRNEAWHYELRRAAITRGCPAMYADPTHDPRMQP